MTSRLRAFLPRFLSISPHTAAYFRISMAGLLKAMICLIALSFGASQLAVAQVETEAGAAARRSKVMAFESAWGIAEKGKDAKALDALLDDSLAYTDYDGTLKTKSDFLAEVKSPEHNRQQQVVESTSVRVYENTAVVIGVYRVRGLEKGRPYQRRGRFTDTWVNRDGNWVCVASQYTLLSR
jgi:hypothetical protein